MSRAAEPEIRFVFTKPVDRVAERTLMRAMKRLHLAVDVRHSVKVQVVPAHTVKHGGRSGFGAFVLKRGRPEIWLAAWKAHPSLTDEQHAAELLGVFARELAHYEQWRDGRTLQERGVAVRSRTIAARLRGGEEAAAEGTKAFGVKSI